jgi:hypothetical protein
VFPFTTIPQMGTSKIARSSNGERTNLNEYPPEFTSQSAGIDPVSSNSNRRFSLVKTTPHKSNPSLVHAKIQQAGEAESISGK